MLFTAQRVRRPGDAHEGINVFRRAHLLERWPLDATEALQVETQELWRGVSVDPVGGNRVLSFLDLAFPYDADPYELAKAVGAFTSLDVPPIEPWTVHGSRVGLHFRSSLNRDWVKEFIDLYRAALGG